MDNRLKIASLDSFYLSFSDRMQLAESFTPQSTDSHYPEYVILYSKNAQKFESSRLKKVKRERETRNDE